MPLILFYRTFAPEIETDNFLTITLLNKLKRMKKVITLMLALVAAMAVNAKTVETTVWEGSEAISWNTNVAPGTQFETPSGIFKGLTTGNVVKIYTTTTTTYGDPQYVVTYKAGSGWDWTDLTITVTEGVVSFVVADATIATEIADRGLVFRGQAWTATKITVSKEVEDGELWSGTNALVGNWTNFESLRYAGKGALANAKVGDDIRVTFTNAAEGWQVHVCDASSYEAFVGGQFDGAAKEEAQSVSFRIANATVLEAIQDRGIVVGGKLATLTKIEIVTYPTSYDAVAVTIGEDGIATFSSTKKLDFTETGLNVYFASAVSVGNVKLTKVNTTWDYQGYIIKGSKGTYDVPVASNAQWNETNYLIGQTGGGNVTASNSPKFHYIFAKDNNGNIGFYKLTADHTLGAKKAYLETTEDIAPPSAARVSLVFDDDTTTGVESVAMPSQPAASGCYDLQGRQVKNPTKGLYIVNGKKVMVK